MADFNVSKTISKISVVYSIVVTVGIVVMYLSFESYKKTAKEIQVEKLTIVDKGGNRMLVLANSDSAPNPVIEGVEYERDVNPAGIIIFNDEGNERGGMVVSNSPDGEQGIFALDYSTVEAVVMYKIESTENTMAGIVINDPNPPGKVGGRANDRIRLSTTNKVASLDLKDTKGNIRIQLVIEDEIPKILIFDEEGNLVQNLVSN